MLGSFLSMDANVNMISILAIVCQLQIYAEYLEKFFDNGSPAHHPLRFTLSCGIDYIFHYLKISLFY